MSEGTAGGSEGAPREWVGPLVAALVAAAVGLSIIDRFPVGVLFDDGMYVILAKSIATGHGLHWLQLPGQPPAAHFPPGYPAVLALLWLLYPHFPANVILFKAASACFLAASAAGLAVFVRRRFDFSRWGAAAFAIATTIGVPTLVLSAQVMSEPLFLALLVPVLLLAEQIVERDDRQSRVPAFVALGALVGLVTLVRTNGIAIAAGIGAVLLLRRRIRDAAVFAASAFAVLVPWQLWVHRYGGAVPPVMGGNYEPYATWLANGFREQGAELAARTLALTTRQAGEMLELMAAPSMPHLVQVAALVGLLVLSAVGGRALWRRAPVTAGFLGCYLLIVLFWPFAPARFLWAIWPFLILLPVLGAVEAMRWPAAARLHTARYLMIGCACLLALGYARYNERAYRGRWWSSAARQNARVARPIVQWVAAHTTSGDVIASDVEPMIYLYADRQVVPASQFTVRDFFRPPTSAESADALRGILKSYTVGAIAVAPRDSLRASLHRMSTGAAPELVLRDTLSNGLVFAPARR